ncbi:MAG: class I SAM-dependent methyltransferase [Cyclobacteriaceae bacterium]
MNDFDKIAGFYDPIKRLIFGRKLNQAYQYYLPRLNEGDHVLIIGGGTGKILRHIPFNVRVTYVEKSRVMIKYARQNASLDTEFYWADFLHFESPDSYDWVICPFFLDVFDSEHLAQAIAKIRTLLKEEGKLIVTDFKPGERLQKLFVKVMYWFFKITTNIEAGKLLDINKHVLKSGFEGDESVFFMKNLIFSRIYRK